MTFKLGFLMEQINLEWIFEAWTGVCLEIKLEQFGSCPDYKGYVTVYYDQVAVVGALLLVLFSNNGLV